MKSIWLLLCVFVSSLSLTAQEVCSVWYPLQKDTKFQITSYDKGGDKASAIIDYTVKDAGSDWALLAYSVSDKKGDVVAESEYEIRCENDGISIDFKSLGAPGILEQYEDMEVEVSGTNLFVPNRLLEGDALPDSIMLMTVNMSPLKLNLSVDITNRRVEGSETITTPAGTFDCIILAYDFATKMGIKVSGSARQWIAKGVGMVKQEDRNRKGKVMSWSQLTAFNN